MLNSKVEIIAKSLNQDYKIGIIGTSIRPPNYLSSYNQYLSKGNRQFILISFFILYSCISGYSQQFLEFSYDSTGYSIKREILSIIQQNDYVRIKLLSSTLNKGWVYWENAQTISCFCKDEGMKQFRPIIRFNYNPYISTFYDSLFQREYYFDKSILGCKNFNIYENNNLLIKNVKISGPKNTIGSPQVKTSENIIHIGSMIDEKSNLSTATMLLSFLQQYPIVENKKDILKLMLGNVTNMKGYSISGKHSWKDMKHYFYLYEDNKLIKEFIFEHNLSYKYNILRDKETINIIDDLNKGHGGSDKKNSKKIKLLSNELVATYIKLHKELSLILSNYDPLLENKIKLKNSYKIFDQFYSIGSGALGNIVYNLDFRNQKWKVKKIKDYRSTLKSIAFFKNSSAWFPMPYGTNYSSASKFVYYNGIKQDNPFDPYFHYTTFDEILPDKANHEYLNYLYLLHQFDYHHYLQGLGYMSEEIVKNLKSKVYPLHEHNHIPIVYLVSAKTYKKNGSKDAALHTFYNSYNSIEKLPFASPWEHYYVKNLITREFYKIYQEYDYSLILSELFILLSEMQISILNDSTILQDYKNYLENRTTFNNEVERMTKLANAASDADLLNSLKLIASIGATVTSKDFDNLGKYKSQLDDWYNKSVAIDDNVNNILQDDALVTNIDEMESLSNTGINSKGEFVAKELIRLLLMQDPKLRKSNLISLQKFFF